MSFLGALRTVGWSRDAQRLAFSLASFSRAKFATLLNRSSLCLIAQCENARSVLFGVVLPAFKGGLRGETLTRYTFCRAQRTKTT